MFGDDESRGHIKFDQGSPKTADGCIFGSGHYFAKGDDGATILLRARGNDGVIFESEPFLAHQATEPRHWVAIIEPVNTMLSHGMHMVWAELISSDPGQQAVMTEFVTVQI